MAPRIVSIKRLGGIAGQVSYTATVCYPEDDGQPTVVEFVGNVYGGPVVMITRMGSTEVQRFVDEPYRFGKFQTNWVKRFFNDDRMP
jgi:hypothetical protein